MSAFELQILSCCGCQCSRSWGNINPVMAHNQVATRAEAGVGSGRLSSRKSLQLDFASRIESLTKHFGTSILLSEDSLEKIGDKEAFHLRFLGKVRVKGKREAIGIYECFDGDPSPMIERKLDTLSQFQEGRAYYLDGRFKEAMEAFEGVLRNNPEDATTQLFLNRIAHYLTHGKPEGWTGVELMEEK